MNEALKTILLACIPALISGIAAVLVARFQIKSTKEQNKHEIEKLMKQHEIDIQNLQEKHSLEMEAKEKDHQNQLELQKNSFENELQKLKAEGDNSAAVEGIKGVFSMIENAFNTPAGQEKLNDIMKNAKSVQNKD